MQSLNSQSQQRKKSVPGCCGRQPSSSVQRLFHLDHSPPTASCCLLDRLRLPQDSYLCPRGACYSTLAPSLMLVDPSLPPTIQRSAIPLKEPLHYKKVLDQYNTWLFDVRLLLDSHEQDC